MMRQSVKRFLASVLFFAVVVAYVPAIAGGPVKELRKAIDAKLKEVDTGYKEKERRLLQAYKQAMRELNMTKLSPAERDRKGKDIRSRYEERKKHLYSEWQKERNHWIAEKRRLSKAEVEAGNIIKRKLRELREQEKAEVQKTLDRYKRRREEAVKRKDDRALKLIIKEQTEKVLKIHQRYEKLRAKWQGRKDEIAISLFKRSAPEKTMIALFPEEKALPRLKEGVGRKPELKPYAKKERTPSEEKTWGKPSPRVPEEGGEEGPQPERKTTPEPTPEGTEQKGKTPTVSDRGSEPEETTTSSPSSGTRVVTTESLRMTGFGRREVETESLKMTGLGRREVTTKPLRMTGFGKRVVTTETLKMTGFGRREIGTETLKMSGFSRREITTETLRMTGFGLRENPQ